MKNILCIAAALIGALAAPRALAQIAIDSIGGAEITFDGFLQADANWYDSDIAELDGDPRDSDDADYKFRSAQFYLKGKGPGRFDWVIGYEGRADKWLDLNARYKWGDWGEQFVQLGQFKQPIGLEALSAAKRSDFMSLAMVTNTFALGRRLGVAYSFGHAYDRTSGESEGQFERQGDWGITASYFGRELTDGLARGSGYGIRGTWALFNAEARILHFGISYVDYDTPADTLRLRARPNADLTSIRLVDTGRLTDTDRVTTIGAEAFWVYGAFKLQAEYMVTDIPRYRIGSQDFSGTGGYVSGLWNINGQSWRYTGGEPALAVGPASGTGMWQVGLRYDVLDLNDNALQGGRMETVTVGVNWYWRSHFKAVFNYVVVDSERAGIEDDPNIAEARLQLHW